MRLCHLFPLMTPPSEVFVSDQTSNLFAVDMRNGRVIYGYKGNSPFFCHFRFLRCTGRLSFLQGIAGAITSMAPGPTGLISTSLDRYARVHSTYPPPPEAGQPQDEKGAVLEKVYMKTIPTCVVWDGVTYEGDDGDDGDDDLMRPGGGGDDDDSGDDEVVWAGMQVAGDSENEGHAQAQRRRTGRQ